MKKMILVLLVFTVVMSVAGTAFAPLVTKVDKSKSCSTSSSSGSSTQVDSGTVDLRDKDTSKPVKSLK